MASRAQAKMVLIRQIQFVKKFANILNASLILLLNTFGETQMHLVRILFVANDEARSHVTMFSNDSRKEIIYKPEKKGF